MNNTFKQIVTVRQSPMEQVGDDSRREQISEKFLQPKAFSVRKNLNGNCRTFVSTKLHFKAFMTSFNSTLIGRQSLNSLEQIKLRYLVASLRCKTELTAPLKAPQMNVSQ